MPFSLKVRTNALVAAARHCCVCHRYGGLGVEVHHIDPEADSGDNSAANAVALCFDCHAAAGHYNPRHPKGTKYSPRELREARDAWHQIVQERGLGVPPEDILLRRYLLCTSVELTREVAAGDLADVPAPAPLLLRNDVSALQRKLAGPYEGGRHEDLYGDAFPSETAYFKAHPDAQNLSDTRDYPYFSAVRPVADADAERVAREDPLVRTLLAAGVPADELLSVYALYDACGGGGHQESYRLRPLWSLYFAATNTTGSPIRVRAVVGRSECGGGLLLRPLDADTDGTDRHPVPPCLLPSGATLLLPVATLLGPLDYVETDELASTSSTDIDGQVQAVTLEDLSSTVGATAVIGPAFWPSHVETDAGEQPVHAFDPAHTYAVTRYWEMGSCPHLFVEIGGRLSYVRELFVETPGLPNTESYIVPPGGQSLVVAELEDETTHLVSIEVNGALAVGAATLHRGDEVALTIQAGDLVRFTGHYVADRESHPQPWEKNRTLSSFVRSYRPQSAPSPVNP